jgi:hypothetical protein
MRAKNLAALIVVVSICTFAPLSCIQPQTAVPSSITASVLTETPSLQRPPVDDYTKVIYSFYVGEPPKSYSGNETYIPYGSIIYHWANGIAEVFGPDGRRILIAKDSEATQMPVPAGVIAPVTHVFGSDTGTKSTTEEDSTQRRRNSMRAML